MRMLEIRSNGRLETTTLHLNGEQLVGVRELFIDLKEDGTFDAWLTYENADSQTLSKRLFSEYLEKLRVAPAGEVTAPLAPRSLVIEGDGEIADTTIALDNERLDGLVELFVYLRRAQGGGFWKWKREGEHDEFMATATFRNEDGTLDHDTLF